MLKTANFSKRIGAVHIPRAVDLIPGPERTPRPRSFGPAGEIEPAYQLHERELTVDPSSLTRWPLARLCLTGLKEGCYSLYYRPKGLSWFGPVYRGTLRVEHVGLDRRISGDLYSYWAFQQAVWQAIAFAEPELIRPELHQALQVELATGDAPDTGGVIPIYPRSDYYSYLACTGGIFTTLSSVGTKCWFALNFDEYRYQHPATGFSGSFPTTPTRSIRFVLNHTDTPDLYSGKAYEGSTELGTVSIRWVSPDFRRATLVMHTLQGAEAPPEVTDGGMTENFGTVFETAGWDLTVVDGGTIQLPAALQGVQDPDDCWTRPNSATLMASVPGYNPDELDKVWKARLIAIPAKVGCFRGRMFDNSTGDPNDVPREGAVTHSHDGYPRNDSSNFGAAEDGLQKDFPRAFLRSAAHEVGHTFNQIHQTYEGGADNSIMTTTPNVADVLADVGLTFPGDINLAFNDMVRGHLRHLPDPAVRPGAMEFFGAAISAPQAEEVVWLPEIVLSVDADSDSVRLGEPLPLRWELANNGEQAMSVPSQIDVESLTARVSVTDPRGNVTFMRPPNQEPCVRIPFKRLESRKSIRGSTIVFWGRDGFAFEQPGHHVVEVIVLWDIGGVHFGAAGETEVWVEYPLTRKDNQIAAVLLNPDVGRAIAFGNAAPWGSAERRIKQAFKLQKGHPACVRLKKLALTE